MADEVKVPTMKQLKRDLQPLGVSYQYDRLGRVIRKKNHAKIAYGEGRKNDRNRGTTRTGD